MKRYETIYHDLKQDVVTQKLKQGERLPSISSLAKQYQCSKGTVIKALDLLSTQHIVFSKPKSGYYVANGLLPMQENPKGFYLDTGNPTIDAFPILDIKHCLHLAVDLYAKHSLEISLAGIPSLNALLHKHLAVEGVYARPENIHLIQGITPILTFLTLTPFPNRKETILIEQPSYSYYLFFLKQTDVKVKTIHRDENGINLQQLEHHFKYDDIKFFYTIPRNHNPLGTSYTTRQRKKIMELAVKYDVYVVEDDYFGNTHKLAKYASLHFFSSGKHCIYLRSYSKEFPFIRVGFAVIPDSFQATFEEIADQSYYYSYHMPNLISQATLESYIQSSIYKKHTLHLHQSIHKKLRLVHRLTATWNAEFVKLIGATSGYYFTLKINPNLPVEHLIDALEKRDVFVTSNAVAYYENHQFDNSLRLSVARVSLPSLKEVLSIIYETILDFMAHST